MNISIRPDPAFPQGGQALMSIAAAPGADLRISIHDLASERWLGETGWQSSECELGPFSVRADGQIVLGPNIVDAMEAYMPLEVEVAGRSARLNWPEAVLPSPTEAREDGGLTVVRKKPYGGPAETSVLSEEIADPVVHDEPESHELPEDDDLTSNDQHVAVDDGRTLVSPRRALWLIVFGILLVAAATALYFWFWKYDSGPIFEPEPDGHDGGQVDCSGSGFDSVGELPILEQMDFARACGGRAAPEDLLRVLEAGVSAELPEALSVMGALYDPGVPASGPLAVTRKNPAIAAEYYSRAQAAGDGDVFGKLSSVCALLDPEDLLHADVIETYCPE